MAPCNRKVSQTESDGPSRRGRAGATFDYLIEAGPVVTKIGFSVSPRGRLSELQVGSAWRLSLFHTWRTDRPQARLFERRLHGLLDWARARGEWFLLSGRDVRSVGRAVIEGGDAATLSDLLRQFADFERRRQSMNARRTDEGLGREREKVAQAYLDLQREEAVCRLKLLALGLEPSIGEAYHADRGQLISMYETLASAA